MGVANIVSEGCGHRCELQAVTQALARLPAGRSERRAGGGLHLWFFSLRTFQRVMGRLPAVYKSLFGVNSTGH